MNNIFRLLKTIVGNHKGKFIFLNFLTLLSTLADMISLGSLTAYISFIFDKQILIDFLKKRWILLLIGTRARTVSTHQE